MSGVPSDGSPALAIEGLSATTRIRFRLQSENIKLARGRARDFGLAALEDAGGFDVGKVINSLHR